ncbi:gustatory receptor for sugar taste 64f-like [Hyposmocoma kahamanoa]|uniref:gustatory receptor for sugar taste 64f-like n=1 Tax=Hyposmocoma kahamanoa TaxID=1477025 RepID=UPI000E6D7F99|nr:gustatory receptor for sugar taste 64f-like [Hyposmocoma kahamanoa]
MKLTILVGQCFGILPVLGASHVDTTKLRFTFCSGRCVYAIINIIGQGLMFILCVLKLFKETDSLLASNTSVVFFSSNCLTGILFLRLARIWPKLSQFVAKTEAADPNLDKTLVRNCNISCILILSMAFLEHFLSDVSSIAIAIDCQPETNVYDAFIYQSFPWVWTFVPYSPVMGFLVIFINITCTFNWNFADVFVICVSLYLTSRLQQINYRINAVRGKQTPSSFWRTMREDYSRVSHLVKKIDDAVSGIVFLSFVNNLFFICLQLLHTLEEGVKQTPGCYSKLDERPMHGYEQAVYFIYSFSFLLVRSLAVSLIASRIHTASRAVAPVLYDVPSDCYCIEVQRFLHHIHGDTIALTGLQFFNVKRGLVLTIAGTIVTYELVLMQFTGVTPTAAPTSSTTLQSSA